MMTHTTIMRAVHNNRSTLRLCIFIALSITLTVKPQPLGAYTGLLFALSVIVGACHISQLARNKQTCCNCCKRAYTAYCSALRCLPSGCCRKQPMRSAPNVARHHIRCAHSNGRAILRQREVENSNGAFEFSTSRCRFTSSRYRLYALAQPESQHPVAQRGVAQGTRGNEFLTTTLHHVHIAHLTLQRKTNVYTT